VRNYLTKRSQRHCIAMWTISAIIAATVVIFGSASSVADHAKAGPAGLADLGMFRVTATQTTSDAHACGLDLRRILPRLRNDLVAGGMQARAEADAMVTLTIITAHDAKREVCATSPMLGVYRKISYFDDDAGWLRTGHIALWQKGTGVVSGMADHPSAVAGAVDRLAETLLKNWRSAKNKASANK